MTCWFLSCKILFAYLLLIVFFVIMAWSVVRTVFAFFVDSQLYST